MNATLSGMLAMLGYSCIEPKLMYGDPNGQYVVKGTVKTEAGEPVEGAQMILRIIDGDRIITSAPEWGKTDAEGNYAIYEPTSKPIETVRVVCHPEGDALEPDSVDVKAKFKGENSWNCGTATINQNFELSQKEPTLMYGTPNSLFEVKDAVPEE